MRGGGQQGIMGKAVRALRQLAVCVMSSSLLAVAEAPQAAAAPGSGVNAPDFHVVTLTGEPVSKATIEGRATLLAFWAPWCKVCQRELPLLGEFYQHEKPGQLQVLSIGFADSRTHVEEFVKGQQGTFVFPTAYDDDNRMARDYRINATPTSWRGAASERAVP